MISFYENSFITPELFQYLTNDLAQKSVMVIQESLKVSSTVIIFKFEATSKTICYRIMWLEWWKMIHVLSKCNYKITLESRHVTHTPHRVKTFKCSYFILHILRSSKCVFHNTGTLSPILGWQVAVHVFNKHYTLHTTNYKLHTTHDVEI